MKFTDRAAAGRALAGRLQHYAGRDDNVVLGLPRGGVPVALGVARDLGAPLDVLLVRTVSAPGHEARVLGAVAEGGVTVVRQDLMIELAIPQRAVTEAIAREQQELERRARLYRGERPPAAVRARTAIVVDDGLAGGEALRAAAGALRRRHAKRIVVAVPVAAAADCEQFRGEVDELVCLRDCGAVRAAAEWYEDVSLPADEELRRLLGPRAVPAPE
ncbi:MAG TPA: phosphoribosyltransferase family protein [Burkholderiales bacterium]